jgi:hypothetical protein
MVDNPIAGQNPTPSPSLLIPLDARAAILQVIDNDEGGWVLTSDPDGGDGGWTYAGVTNKTWAAYTHDSDISITLMESRAVNFPEEIRNKVYEIYYKNYFSSLITFDQDIRAMELSCAINCGPATARKIAFGSKDKLQFAHNWLLHYGSVIKAKPEKVIYIDGWINRVFRYLSPADIAKIVA